MSARGSTKKTAIAGRFSAGRLLFVAMMLLVFSVQSFVTQTHIHAFSVVKAVSHNSTGHDNYPGDDDPANCPLCQQVLHNGQFVAPASLAIFLPMLAVSVIVVAIRPAPRFAAITHIWLGRGPPQH